MFNKYFEGTIIAKEIEDIPYYERHWFVKEKKYKTGYNVIIQLDNTVFTIQTPATITDYEHATIGEKVSVMLIFDVDFVCYHHRVNPIMDNEDKSRLIVTKKGA